MINVGGKKDSKVLMVALYMATYTILFSLYVYYVYPVWGYMGFELNINETKIAVSACIIVIFVLITPTSPSVRSYFLNLALTISLLPSLVLYAFADKPTSSALVIWIAFAIVYGVSAIPVARVTTARLSPRALLRVLLFALICLLGAFFALGGLGNFNLDIRRVYEFREDAARSLPGIFAYLSPIFSKIIIPFGIVFSIFYRNYIIAALVLLSAILIFGFTNHKAILFYPIVSIAIFYTLSWSRRYSVVLTIFILALTVGTVDSLASADPESFQGWYASIFVRRALMIPALLDYHYIEFFSNNPWYFWATSRLSFGLVENPYGIATPFVIGNAYFNSAETAANTGYIGSGFAQAGIAGTMIYAAGVGLIIGVLQAYGRYLGLPLVAAIMTSQVITMFFATDFVTLFLTHGMLVSLFLLSLTNPPSGRPRSQIRWLPQFRKEQAP